MFKLATKSSSVFISMSISRLNASWLAGHNENTLALANVNFNFALVKIAPPSEYSGLGMVLSSSRRRAAEDGELHRKLSSSKISLFNKF